MTYEKTCVTLTVQVNIHDTTLVEKPGQAVSAFLRGDIHYGEYHRRKHTKISGTDRTAAFTDRLRGDCTGAETAIGKYAFRTVSGQPSDGAPRHWRFCRMKDIFTQSTGAVHSAQK